MNDLLFTIWVTSACNLRCKYCYEGINKTNKSLTVENANQIMKFISDTCQKVGCTSCRVSFHGGEPSLNFPIIKYIMESFENKTGVMCSQYRMTTNAYNLTNDMMIFFSDQISDLTVSIDGTEISHNINRVDAFGNGTFKNVMKNAQFILKRRQHNGQGLRLRMTLNTDNYMYLYESVVFLIENGFQEIIPGVDYGDARWSDHHFDEIFSQYKEIRKYIITNAPNAYVSSMSKDEITKKDVCDGCKSSFHFAPDGKIYPCVYVVDDPNYCMGDIWKGIDVMKLSLFDKINISPIPECTDCGFYDYCATKRCKYINQKLTGDYFTPSPVVCASERLLLQMVDNSPEITCGDFN